MARRLIDDGGEPRGEARERVEPVRIPVDPVNEQVLLVAAALDAGQRTKLTRRLAPGAFLVAEHRTIWAALTEIARRGLEYDASTLRQLSGGQADARYLDDLVAQRVEAPANVDHHVAMLEWDRRRVEAVQGPLARLHEALRDPTTAPERVQVLAAAVSRSFEGSSGLIADSSEVARQARAEYQERKRRACYGYGIEGLDRYEDGTWRMIPGRSPGKITVVTACPGAGKSTFACRVALAAAQAGERVLFGAWEMHNAPSLELIAVMSLGLTRYAQSTAELTAEQEAALDEERERIGQYVKFVDNPARRRVARSPGARGDGAANERALDLLGAAILDSGADLAIFDLWKRVLTRTEPDDEELALIRQQDVAEETKCHCMLLQQQRSKDVEQRPDKRPTREGIKGSGAWVEVADTILGVHRPALWKRVDDSVLEVAVLKQRWGRWPCAVEFEWDANLGSIRGGKSIDYDLPSLDETAASEFIGPPRGGRGRGKGKS